MVRRDSPAALVPRPPATPPMVRPVRGTHQAGRRRVGCPPRPQSAAATPAGPAEGEGGGLVVAKEYVVRMVVKERHLQPPPPFTARGLDHYVPEDAPAARWARWSP